MTPRLRLIVPPSPCAPEVGDTAATGTQTTTAAPSSSSPARFARSIRTIAALPWRQRQIAELEARLTAPAPMEVLDLELKRQTPWRPGQAGVFLATYTRASPARRPPRSGLARLLPTADSRSKQSVLILGAGGAAVALLMPYLAVTAALNLRTDRALRLSQVEQQLVVTQRRAKIARRRATEAAILDRNLASTLSARRMLQDLDWVAMHRRAGVAVSAVHWAHGVTALEVSSETSPVDPGRRVERAPKPLRPGVYLWGVASSGETRP